MGVNGIHEWLWIDVTVVAMNHRYEAIGEMAANDGITNSVTGSWKTGANMEELGTDSGCINRVDKDRLRQLLGYLAESLQEVTGMDQAGDLSLWKPEIGDELNAHYLS